MNTSGQGTADDPMCSLVVAQTIEMSEDVGGHAGLA
jgi:hypothetical protein